ncbi:MAG: hypothetical protein J4215_02380 [Candidatus Diapherotrites archaeon]|uniref:PEP-utilising enzyme mobile domain-containing protein n=1 Tax=Candidatus Iainarchaeum sp. TaxID=3101447 RepID=A0A8T4L4E3_9ARCH|nr:hypothetical protein [Candidatus Diapherotrites archaeon]
MEKILQGVGVSSGKIRGKVKVILEKTDWPSFQNGDILVTRITDPTMVPLMSKAGGIICDIGAMMSHPAIVAREMGIPCVVGTRDATVRLRNGQLVEMDGKTGEVFALEK